MPGSIQGRSSKALPYLATVNATKSLLTGPTAVHCACARRSRRMGRLVFEAIVYVLRTGCQWKALPTERFGSASAIHKRYLEWQKFGAFEALWKAGLAEYDDFEGIAWRWQSINGAMMKAPLAQEAVGPNPTDRGKKWEQAPPAGGRP